MNKKNILKGASVLLITAFMIFSSSATIADTIQIKQTEKMVNEPCDCEQTAIISQGNCPLGMISYWKLDDGSGSTTAADSQGSHTGTLAGNPVWTTGQVLGALDLDGNDCVSIDDHSDFHLGTGEFTFEAWINGGGTDSFPIILSKRTWVDLGGQPEADGFIFGLENGQLFVQLQGMNYLSNGQVVGDTGRWHHVVATRNINGLVTFYVDGEQSGSTYTSNNDITVDNLDIPWHIGWDWLTDNYWDGLLDEVAIYDEALSICEIRCHYNLGLDGLGYCDGTVQNIDTNLWYHWIQDAIDASIGGQEIEVYTPDIDFHPTGEYVENVVVEKDLTIRAADGCSPIIDGDSIDDAVYIRSNNVNIIGFTIHNSGLFSGVLIDEGRCHNNIENNVIIDNFYGVHLMDNNKYNSISNNTIIENDIGIFFLRSSENYIFNNTIEENEQGILFFQSILNTIINNSINYQVCDGIRFEDSRDTNLIHGNNITYNGQGGYNGIIITSCENNIITYNNITFNDHTGIRLVESSSTTITCNNISSNEEYGIYMEGGSSNNLIYANNFIDNKIEHAWDPFTNAWHNDRKWGGNYWDDYKDQHTWYREYYFVGVELNPYRWRGLPYNGYEIPGGGANRDEFSLSRPSFCVPGAPNVFNQPSPQSSQQSAQLSNNPSSQQNHKQPSFLILRYILGLL